ncbi:unnamed protein product [Withania somnifera]
MVPEILGSLLNHCSKTNSFHFGLSLHAAAIKSGLQGDVFISNHMLNMYAKCGNINFASQNFNEMSKRNLVTWSAMISGYDQVGKHLMAINLYSQMPLKPNEFVLASALSSCANLLALKLGRQIHAHLISMYMKNGQCSDALSIFAFTPSLTDVSYNTILVGLVESNQREKAFEVYESMCQEGLVPDCFTFVGLLGTCNTAHDLGKGMQLHSQTIKIKLDGTAFIGNIIMTMYSNLNLLDEADKVFGSIKEKDVISWNTLIAACSRCDDHSKALAVFKEMSEYFDGRPDEFTYASLLSACASVGSMQFGWQIHAHLIRTSSSVDIGVDNALVNMYAKCGCIQYASKAFSLMTFCNLVSWNSVITGFANHGHGKKSYKIVLGDEECWACREGVYYFNAMNEIYGATPDIEHFSCLIDLLGRAGRLKDAEEYMQRYPFGHDSVVLGCLLSACRLHGD